jgi:SAM-dependent methyltransferase
MDPYAQIAALYDLEHDEFTDDIDLFRNLVVAGPVLEVGAGTGRIVHALAADGHDVWAVEPSTAMLDRARARIGAHSCIHLLQGDAQSLDDLSLPSNFRVALLSLNLLWHLPTVEVQRAALRAVHRHLVPMGLLVVDSTNPLSMLDRGARGELRERFSTTHDGADVRAISSAWDDPAEQTIALGLIYDTTAPDGTLRRTSTSMELRYIYRYELQLLLESAGFIEEQLYGSYDLEPYTAESANLISVSRAQ